MVIRTPPDTPGSEEPNTLEESGYEVLSDVVTLTSEEDDENDGTTVSLPSYDGDTPDDLSSDVGSDESQNSNHQDNALHFGSTISGTASGLTVTGRPGDHICDNRVSASAYGFNERSSWWRFNTATALSNVHSAFRLTVDNRIRPMLRKIKQSASLHIPVTGVLLMLATLSVVSFSLSHIGYYWSNGSLQYLKSQPEILRQNAALDSAVSSMVPKSPISFPKLINSGPQVGRSQGIENSEEPWIRPSPHPLSPEANESNKFKMQALGCCNIIITSPCQSQRLAYYQQINVDIERSGEPISFELSHLVEGVNAVTLDAEEAHGELEVRVCTMSRPYINQTMNINMGSPLYKIASWKSFFSENRHKAKTALGAAADVTVQNMNNLASGARTVGAKLKESFDENVPFMIEKVQIFKDNGANLIEKASLSSANIYCDFKKAIRSAGRQSYVRTAEVKERLLNDGRVLMVELRDRAHLYQKQATPVDDLVRTGMRSSVVKRARSQAIDLWIRIKNFGGRPISSRVGSGLGNLNAKSLMPWGDYEFSISRGFQCSSSKRKSKSRKERSESKSRSEWIPALRKSDEAGKKQELAKSGSRGVLRL